MITIRGHEELLKLEEASRIVLETLDAVEKAVAPGVTTEELDRVAEAEIRRQGARPAFIGYRGYPKTLCTSVNDEVVHGIPGKRALKEGDVVGIDCGAVVDGYFGDAARTLAVGRIPAETAKLVETTRKALMAGIAAVRPGGGSRTSAPPSRRSPSSTATGSSGTSSATAWGRPCTRSRRSRTTGRRGGAAC